MGVGGQHSDGRRKFMYYVGLFYGGMYPVGFVLFSLFYVAIMSTVSAHATAACWWQAGMIHVLHHVICTKYLKYEVEELCYRVRPVL